MALKNPWIGYITRSYEQIKQDILTKFPINTPELTDHTENNIFVRLVSVWAGITEHLGYYIDKSAQEVFLPTQTRYENAIKIAKMFDYRVRGVIPASADLKFTLSGPSLTAINIPLGTKIETSDGIIFVTTQSATIAPGDTFVIIPAEQKELVNSLALGNSDGTKFQNFVIAPNIVDNSIGVLVDSIVYNHRTSLSLSKKTEKDFTSGLNENQEMTITFGDGVNGFIPPNGDPIVVSYATSLGSAGNIPEDTITNLIDVPTLPSGISMDVTNINRASGGADIEDLEDLKINIPLSIRTLLRAVTEQDYIDIATLAPGVAKAGVDFNCGKTVDVYIVPEGGGIASTTLLASVVDWFDDKRMITTKIQALPAGEVQIILNADIRVLPNYSKINTENNAKQNLLDFLSIDTQEISGEVQIGDIYEVLENTEGIDYSKVNLVSIVPYARPISHNVDLNWSRTLKPTSTATHIWKVVLIGTTLFELYKDGSFIGQYNLSFPLTFPEIDFIINPASGYSIGQSWEFTTYPYNASLNLDEPSVPVLYATNLTLNTTGGF